ncbi:MAG: trypsin-like peptidase domain-containing protein, partial [Planctomycetes bacterium]|nr:trypsin-like peptidase domain-containing protein [Planctomycetota bacterium]
KMRQRVFQLRVVFDKETGSKNRSIQNGSCVAIDPPGRFLTAAHVVQRADKAGKTLPVAEMRIAIDGHSNDAEIIAVNPKYDVALIALKPTARMPKFATTPFVEKAPRVDQEVFHFGFPVRTSGANLLSEATVAGGRITNTEHKTSAVAGRVIRVRGSTHFGASGGVLVNRDGQLLGIIVAAEFEEKDKSTTHMMAVPTTAIRKWLNEVASGSDADPDGDGLVGIGDPNPMIAELPDVSIRPTGEVKFHLRTEITSLRRRTSFAAVDRSRSETVRLRQSMNSIDWQLGAIGLVQAPGLMLPIPVRIGGGGEYRETSTEFSLDRTRLKYVSHTLTSMHEEKVKIGPNAWVLNVEVTVRNSSGTPCVLTDFDVNVWVNGKLRWTKRASKAANTFPQWELTTSESSTRLLQFAGLNRSEVEPLLRDKSPPTITVEIPPASIKLRQFSGSRRMFPVPAIVRKCAVVDVVTGGRRQRRYVSVVGEDGRTGITVEDLIRRFSGDRPVRWGDGPSGDYLAEFLGREGLGVFLHGKRARGRWLIRLDSERKGRLTMRRDRAGRIRQEKVRPADRLELVYIDSKRLHDALDSWKGYVAVYRDWRDIAQKEKEFWEEWGSTKELSKKKRSFTKLADKLLGEYEKFFTRHRDNRFLMYWYPDAKSRQLRFRAWFPGNGVIDPTKLELKFRSASF